MHYLRPFVPKDVAPPLDVFSLVSLVAGVFAMLPGGCLYTFALFSPMLVDELQLSQKQVALGGSLCCCCASNAHRTLL
jgi:hypothetical protein